MPLAFRADYHVHVEKGPYTLGWLERFAAVARREGLQEIGLSEHLCDFHEGQDASGAWWEEEGEAVGVRAAATSGPGGGGGPGPSRQTAGLAAEDRAYSRQWWQGRPRCSLQEYVSFVRAARLDGVTLRLGLEVDYFPRAEEGLRRLLAAYPLDFVLGSVHWLDGWGFDHLSRVERWQGRDVDEVYRRYFAELGRAARSGLFDVIAHPDLVKVAGHRPAFDPTPLYEEAARALAAAGVAAEVSTAGLRKPVHEIYPAEPFLRLLRQHDVPITLASDAHRPEDVGRDFAASVALARRCGYTRICRFVQRRREEVELA